jgi:hypothetical protein
MKSVLPLNPTIYTASYLAGGKQVNRAKLLGCQLKETFEVVLGESESSRSLASTRGVGVQRQLDSDSTPRVRSRRSWVTWAFGTYLSY